VEVVCSAASVFDQLVVFDFEDDCRWKSVM
jgi:hypothetical protein